MLIHLIGIHKLLKVYLLVWLGLQRRGRRVDDVSRLQRAGGGRGKRLNHSRQSHWRQMTGRLHWRSRLAAQLLHLHPGAAHRGGQGGEEADRLLRAAGGHPVLVLQVGHLTLLFLLFLFLFLLFHLLLSLLCQLTVVTFLSRAVAATRVVPVSS